MFFLSNRCLNSKPHFHLIKSALFVTALSTIPLIAHAQPGPRSVWNIKERGAFVMSSLRDQSDIYWFGTEDNGVWRYDPRLPLDQAWRQFTVKDGLGDDNVYALAQDEKGRVWVGHQSHGVSVWNGRAWRNYDVTEGPLGERVFDIAVSPLDGSVWIATNRGLSIYDVARESWRYEGRWTGLPSDQVQALGFAADGTVFVGTQCDGLAIGSPKNNYGRWGSVRGSADMPLYASGAGLPSDVINDVTVTGDDTVYVATGYGLARSYDRGRSWAFLRGADWRARLEGRTFPQPIPPQPKRDTLAEDVVTTLAEDAAGNLWLGHPTKGVEVRAAGARQGLGGGVVEAPDEKQAAARREKFEQEMKQALARGEQPKLRLDAQGRAVGVTLPVKVPDLSAQEKTDYVTSILPIAGEAPLVCGAGSGVVQLGVQLSTLAPRRAGAPLALGVANFPVAAGAPSSEELRLWTARLRESKRELGRPGAVYLGEDWKTKGDWVGRYGTRYAQLCAMQAPFDQFVINDLSYSVEARLGLHPYKDGKSFAEQGLRHWMHRKRWDDERVLWNPLVGYRRQADIDDNGEAYSMNYEGPDLWVGVRVPAGAQRVSLYFFNKDGHDGANRVRDYLIDVKRGREDLAISEHDPILARARVRDFWGGVYKSFAVQGPGDYYFIVRKNNSFNTVLQGVFLDKMSGPETAYEGRRDIWLNGARYEAPTAMASAALQKVALEGLASMPRSQAKVGAALALWNAAEEAGGAERAGAGRLLAYRAVAGELEGGALLEAWKWHLPLWSEAERAQFAGAMMGAWRTYAQNNARGARATR